MKKMMFFLAIVTLSLALVAGSACAQAPQAVSPEEFFKTNTVTLYVNGSAGSGTDYGGRLFASFWSDMTGGPAMPVKVMEGGGGLEGANYVHGAKPDGLTLGTSHHCSDFTLPPLLQIPGLNFDTRTYGWLGFFGFDPMIFFVGKDTPYKTIDDLKKAGSLNFASESPGGNIAVGTAIGVELMGLTNPKILMGFDASELALVVKRGEAVGYAHTASSGKTAVDQGLTRPLFSLTRARTKWFPDVPAITEITKLTPEQDSLLTFIDLAMLNGKSFFTPPGVDPAKLDYLRRTFDKIVALDGFVTIAKRRWSVWEKPLTGQQVEQMTNEVLSLPADKLQTVRAALAKYVK